MKSALFVDFDNVFSQLKALQPAAAERFARQPVDWLRWLTETLSLPAPSSPGAQRRVLVRRCYLNPNWYQGYRHAFLRAGFEIVDCPPVTSQGKTSTDIHMVLDIVELLQHETRYDEFIVLSADADFTPVLRKLRRYDRRTSVLAIGFPSAAYQASADLLIDERLFVDQALGMGGDAVEPPPTPQAQVAESPQNGAAPAPVVQARPATAEELRRIRAFVRATMAEASEPVPAASLASKLKAMHPNALANWNGQGTFKGFFTSLQLDELVWISTSGGRIVDPARHQVDAGLLAEAPCPPAWKAHPDLLPLAREVCQLTGAPLLAPPVMRRVLEALASDVAREPYAHAETAARVQTACLANKPTPLDVSLRDVAFILKGMQLNGHVFGSGQDDAGSLARRLNNQILFLCQREQMVVDDEMRAKISRWIGGDLLVE